MGQISLSFPDSTYTSANKPSADTLKNDLSVIEAGVNANDTAAIKTTTSDVSSTSFVLDEDAMGSDSNQKLATQQSIKAYVDAAITATKAALYPVGSVYVNESVATNPATLLGFGTWAAYGAGRVIVGKAGSGTFDTAGEELGAETVSVAHTHTGPSHTHTYAHTHLSLKNALQSGGFSSEGSDDSNALTYQQSSTTTGADGTGNTGAMSANATPSTLQPSITAYMWKRTA
jgi:hypothetical protein